MGISRTNIIEEFNFLETNFNLSYEQKTFNRSGAAGIAASHKKELHLRC